MGFTVNPGSLRPTPPGWNGFAGHATGVRVSHATTGRHLSECWPGRTCGNGKAATLAACSRDCDTRHPEPERTDRLPFHPSAQSDPAGIHICSRGIAGRHHPRCDIRTRPFSGVVVGSRRLWTAWPQYTHEPATISRELRDCRLVLVVPGGGGTMRSLLEQGSDGGDDHEWFIPGGPARPSRTDGTGVRTGATLTAVFRSMRGVQVHAGVKHAPLDGPEYRCHSVSLVSRPAGTW